MHRIDSRHYSLICASLLTGVLALGVSACGDSETSDPPASTAEETPEPDGTAASDEEVAQAFFDAVVAGDRDAAAAVATGEALAPFEPWEPAPDYTFTMADPSTGMDDTFFISPGAAPFQCTVADGIVQECTDPEAADRS